MGEPASPPACPRPLKKMSQHLSSSLQVGAAAVLWGTVGVATQALYNMSAANALSIGFFRLALSVPALWLVWQLMPRPGGQRARQYSLRPRNRRDWLIVLLLGGSMGLYQVCYFAAISRLGVTVAVLITLCLAPVVVALLAAPLLREPLTGRVAAALVGALLGTALLVGGGRTSLARPGDLAGVLLAMSAAASYAVVTLCSRALAGRYHPLQPITLGFAVGALGLLPFTLAAGLVLSYPPAGWLLLLHLGLVPTALAYILFLRGLRHVPAGVASIITLLESLTSALLAWLLFGEWLSPLSLLGAFLLIAAMLLLLRR